MTSKQSNKRKRQGDQASHKADEDFGNQSLPVAILPDDFNGIPEDGSQYLAMVRREAAAQPTFYHASSNPYAVGSTSRLPASEPQSRAEELRMPNEEQRQEFLTRFKALREAMSHYPEDAPPQSYNNKGRIPKAKLTPAANRHWYRFVFRCEKPLDEDGNWTNNAAASANGSNATLADANDSSSDASDGEADGSDTADKGPRWPTYGLLQRFTIAHLYSLLDAIPYWLPIPPNLVYATKLPATPQQTFEHEGFPAVHPIISQWCFAILTKVDSRLTSDEISSLRVLARSCIAAIALLRSSVADPKQRDESGAWVIVAIIAGIWGQADLWMDAEEDLARVARGGV